MRHRRLLLEKKAEEMSKASGGRHWRMAYHRLVWAYAMSRILSEGHWQAWREGRWGVSERMRGKFCGMRYYGILDFQMLRFQIRRTESMLRMKLARSDADAMALRREVQRRMEHFQKEKLCPVLTEYQETYHEDGKAVPLYAFVFESDVVEYRRKRRSPKSIHKQKWFEKRAEQQGKVADWYCTEGDARIEALLDERHRAFSKKLWTLHNAEQY